MKKRSAIAIGIILAVILPTCVAWIVHARRLALDEECISNLRCIDAAKLQWALEAFALPETNNPWSTDYVAYFNAVPTEEDIHRYNSRNQYPMPKCPRGGKYSIGRVADSPTCTFPGHHLSNRDSAGEFVFEMLVDTYAMKATEVIIGVAFGQEESFPVSCKIDENWKRTKIPSFLRSGIIADLQRRAGLSAIRFPSEGTFADSYGGMQMKWKIQMASVDDECILTPVRN